jgi:hypothetical protein
MRISCASGKNLDRWVFHPTAWADVTRTLIGAIGFLIGTVLLPERTGETRGQVTAATGNPVSP